MSASGESGYKWGIRKRKEYATQLLAKQRAALKLAVKEEKQQKQKHKQGARKKPISKKTKAWLQFPVGKIYRLMKEREYKDQYAKRVAPDASVYLSGVLEGVT